jgi:hypothetical protein
VLELEAFDRLDGHSDSSIDIHTGTRKRKQQKPSTTLYIGDDTTKSWKVLAIGKDEDEEPTSSSSSSLSDQEPKLKQTASASFSNSFGNLQQTFHAHVLQHFLPAHFPNSVAPGYARFTAFGFCASVAGSTGMVLSTQTLLLAVGVVGSGSASVDVAVGVVGPEAAAAAVAAPIMAGALNWVLKDGVGQLGGVIFASKMGQTRRFDSNPKKWRMVAALALDTANLMEIMAPTVSAGMVLPLACLSNTLKNIGFLTASASRAALHQSFSVTGNLGDVTAKAASQSMAAGFLGTAIGVGISTLLQHNAESFVTAFLFLTVIHQGCNYASLQAVALKNFDRHRLHLLLEQYVVNLHAQPTNTNNTSAGDPAAVIVSPSWVAAHEVFVPLLPQDDAYHWLSIGSRLPELCPGGSDEFTRLLQACPNQAHVINWTPDGGRIHLVFTKNADGADLVKGMLHAYLLHHYCNGENASENVNTSMSVSISAAARIHAIAETHRQATEQFPVLLKGLEEQGWTTGTNVTTVEPSNARRLVIDQ